MSDALKFSLVAGLAALSVAVSAETIATVAARGPQLRAQNATVTAPADPLAAPAPAAPATIAKSADGHYWAEGLVNGSHIRFLVDTGATAVALTPADAERLGFDPSRLTYSLRVVTAAGQTRAAPVKLPEVIVAGARVENVDALVIETGLDASLLGMTYLGRLAGFQATRDTLILHG